MSYIDMAESLLVVGGSVYGIYFAYAIMDRKYKESIGALMMIIFCVIVKLLIGGLS